MQTRNLIKFLVLIIISAFLFSCPQEVPLPGDIQGSVTDKETSEPIQDASVKLIQSFVAIDSTTTVNNGTYFLKNIVPGLYDLEVSKFGYKSSSKPIEVDEAETEEINFALIGIPILSISVTFLNFELDLTSLSLTISNKGAGKLAYTFNPSKDWISVYPASGDVTNETDSITVTIDKTGLIDSILYKETIKIISDFGVDTIDVIVNGFMYEGQVYKIVRIGPQTWMAENLNVGKLIPVMQWMADNGIIEKLCYQNDKVNCEIFGGIYESAEAMQYASSDTGSIGTTRGICPNGWHIPTEKEWDDLINYLGGSSIAGGKLKERGYAHWTAPNAGATNETGFTALPGGFNGDTLIIDGDRLYYHQIKLMAFFWTATIPPGGVPINGYYSASHLELQYNYPDMEIKFWPDQVLGSSVRCIKDP